MKLSVLIVNYNVRAFLENTLATVAKAVAGIESEIIVIDNASSDGSVEMLRGKFPSVKVIANEKNVGFAAANNIGMRIATGEYFLLLNPDTIVQEDTVGVMLDFFKDHPEAGLAGCKILNPDGSLQLACRRSFPTPWVAFTKIFGLSSLFPRSPLFGRYNLTYLDPDRMHEVDAVSGSFMFLRRGAFEQVGGLDEQFFLYGEDLDWCYRVKKSGWKIFYVPATQIIHYKGQSIRRSEIDEVEHFYEAMRVFVRKHFERGVFSDVLLQFGIAVREWAAFLGKISRPLSAALTDFILVNAALLLGELIWFGEIFHLPAYAYPVTMTVPGLTIVLMMYGLGVYTKRKFSFPRTAGSVIAGYIILSALTFFFKQYGFSRMIVLISGMITLVLLPGWRLVLRGILSLPGERGGSIFGRRTVIVGAEASGQEVLRKLRTRVDDGYDVVGFIDVNWRRIGERIAGVEILGSIDNIGKVIREQNVSEVIFSTDILSYTDILTVIGRSGNRSVNFRLVPNSLEVIIGRTHIDELDDIPLLEIEYNIDRPVNRFLKRIVDITLSLALMLTVYPFALYRKRSGRALGARQAMFLRLPAVVSGAMSLVGPAETGPSLPRDGLAGAPFLGKPGLTGLVQLRSGEDMPAEEIEKYNLYYAKNQSLILDAEIMVKSFVLSVKQ